MLPLAFTPAPGAAPLRRMIAAQARLETRTLLRNGEQLLLTLVIPLLLLAAFGLEPLVNFGTGMSRIDFLTPGIIALAVMSTAFTSQAIATGFERRYGVLDWARGHSPVPHRADRGQDRHGDRGGTAAGRADPDRLPAMGWSPTRPPRPRSWWHPC